MSNLERSALRLHLLFAVVAAAVLALPLGVALGWRITGLVAFYDAATLVAAYRGNHRDWARIWWFAAILSVFMVWPDRFLAEVLGVLVFPPDGVADLGAVTAPMAGLWTIPITILLLVARGADARVSRWAAYVATALAAGVIFYVSEALLPDLGIWQARGVSTWGNVARYILPAEVLLGPAAFALQRSTRRLNLLADVASAFVVMLVYLGAAAASYLLVEVVAA